MPTLVGIMDPGCPGGPGRVRGEDDEGRLLRGGHGEARGLARGVRGQRRLELGVLVLVDLAISGRLKALRARRREAVAPLRPPRRPQRRPVGPQGLP